MKFYVLQLEIGKGTKSNFFKKAYQRVQREKLNKIANHIVYQIHLSWLKIVAKAGV